MPTVMASPAAQADVKDDLLLRIRRLLDKSKSELQKVWREEEYSDFEPVAKADLLAALLQRLLCGSSDLDSVRSQQTNTYTQKLQGSCLPSRQVTFFLT